MVNKQGLTFNCECKIRLSVDPMSDDYPDLFPYSFCSMNPIKFIEKDGEIFVDANGNRVKVRVGRGGTLKYYFDKNVSEEAKELFLNNHDPFLRALATTREGRRMIRFMNRIPTKISIKIDYVTEDNTAYSRIYPDDIFENDYYYKNVLITPFMKSILKKANESGSDVEEIMGAALMVEAWHLKPRQIWKEVATNMPEDRTYNKLFNKFVKFRFYYRITKGQAIDENIFLNESDLKVHLNLINKLRYSYYKRFFNSKETD